LDRGERERWENSMRFLGTVATFRVKQTQKQRRYQTAADSRQIVNQTKKSDSESQKSLLKGGEGRGKGQVKGNFVAKRARSMGRDPKYYWCIQSRISKRGTETGKDTLNSATQSSVIRHVCMCYTKYTLPLNTPASVHPTPIIVALPLRLAR
jgi:hypothetical protein